jgi:hypothetical protein
VEDACHHLIIRQHVVCVEGVNDTLFSPTEGAGARNTTQHEDAEVVGVDGRGAINYLTGLVVVIKRLPHEVDIVTEGLSKALSEHRLSSDPEIQRSSLSASATTII